MLLYLFACTNVNSHTGQCPGHDVKLHPLDYTLWDLAFYW